MIKWFIEDPLEVTICICLCLMMGSCTVRSIYCEWNGCKVESNK